MSFRTHSAVDPEPWTSELENASGLSSEYWLCACIEQSHAPLPLESFCVFERTQKIISAVGEKDTKTSAAEFSQRCVAKDLTLCSDVQPEDSQSQ